jgi:hypothetical protein
VLSWPSPEEGADGTANQIDLFEIYVRPDRQAEQFLGKPFGNRELAPFPAPSLKRGLEVDGGGVTDDRVDAFGP